MTTKCVAQQKKTKTSKKAKIGQSVILNPCSFAWNITVHVPECCVSPSAYYLYDMLLRENLSHGTFIKHSHIYTLNRSYISCTENWDGRWRGCRLFACISTVPHVKFVILQWIGYLYSLLAQTVCQKMSRTESWNGDEGVSFSVVDLLWIF